MLALTESEGRRHAAGERKRPKAKKRSKHDKAQKRALLAIQKDIEEKDNNAEELQIHELMPVPYKPEDHENQLNATEVTFEQATVTEQDCQQVASISCMDSVPNSNKFVIITLLEPEAQGIMGEELLNAQEITDGDDKTKHTKLQKKVILLHKIDPQATATIQASTEQTAQIVTTKQEDKEFVDGQLMTINFSDFASETTDGKEQRDIGNWIKKFPSLALLYTESGKPYVKCPACTAMFFKASSFEKHVSCHLRKQDERYVCNFCKYDNEDANTIFSHLCLHQDQCEVCNMNLTRKNSFKKHWEYSESQMTFTVKRDRWSRFVCIYCKLGFDLLHQLQKHWFKHSCNSKKTSQCNQCAGIFDTDEALQNHVCLKCPVCGKICDSVHRLRSHTRYEKHYLYCTICTYDFILAVDHEKHMALHKKMYHSHKDYAHCMESEDGTSFQCEICGKIYHTMSCLVLHIHDDHKIPEASRALDGDDDIARISLPEVKDGATSYDIISTLKNELKCEVEFATACEEVLEVQTERTTDKADGTEVTEVNEQCEPVALCWNRYSIDDQATLRKAT
ncbi:hypothetical protein TSAR_004814 [Trichomalopsis sarcophagae]|uniref:C2H2-type domain-containing protein n=1 Tax=Trichomalopsis sarcophagae TaxID=543379 RepID=A0A232F7C8_9HYME|nr:hypothetical protein TSAR_004814 [Trichomalopsis sarcophagae]